MTCCGSPMAQWPQSVGHGMSDAAARRVRVCLQCPEFRSRGPEIFCGEPDASLRVLAEDAEARCKRHHWPDDPDHVPLVPPPPAAAKIMEGLAGVARSLLLPAHPQASERRDICQRCPVRNVSHELGFLAPGLIRSGLELIVRNYDWCGPPVIGGTVGDFHSCGCVIDAKVRGPRERCPNHWWPDDPAQAEPKWLRKAFDAEVEIAE